MTKDLNPKAARASADGKAPLHLIDTAMTHPAARVLASGADKYGVRNWRTVPINASTYVGALRRHIDEWADGSDFDKDSGEHPLAHVAATCNVVLDAIKHGTLVDDRAFAEAKPVDPDAWPGGANVGDMTTKVDAWLRRSVNEGESDEARTEEPQQYCGKALRDNDPKHAWVGDGCLRKPCILADRGCPGLQAGKFVPAPTKGTEQVSTGRDFMLDN